MSSSTDANSGGSPGLSIRQALSNLGKNRLDALAGDLLLRTLEKIDKSDAVDSDTLIEVLAVATEQKGSAALHDSYFRTTLISSLTIEKARELAERLKIPVSRSIYDDLETYRYQDNVDAQTELAGFFGLKDPPRAPARKLAQIESVQPDFGLFEHQRVAANEVIEAIAAPPGRVVLHMPTGAGKTRTAMHVVCRLLTAHRPTLVVWVAQSGELLEQASDAFESAWSKLGNREVSLVRLWGSGRLPDLSGISDGVVVAGLAKLHSVNRKDPRYLHDLGMKTRLTIIDEAHQAIAPTYRVLLEKLADAGRDAALLGLTATPGRSWTDMSADEELSSFFNHNKVILSVSDYTNPVKYLMDEGYLARPTFQKLDVPDTHFSNVAMSSLSSDDDYSTEILDLIGNNAARNAALVRTIMEVIERHRRVIVFASSVQNAELLMSLLTSRGIKSFVVTGETPQGQREYAIRQYKGRGTAPIVICNFGVLTTGFDAPQTSAAIIARPTKSLVLFSQMVGRATRGKKAGGNDECEIVTVNDPHLPGFGDVAEAFVNWEDVWRGT